MNDQTLPLKNSYVISQFFFIRCLGLIYLIAFVSIWPQIHGLIGSEGILPIQNYLEAIKENVGLKGYWLAPGVFWLNGSDIVLTVVCALGVIFSLCVIWGLIQGWALLALWILYLSLFSVGQDFLSFQWDTLLLEVGLLSIFVSSWKWRDRLRQKTGFPQRLALWLMWWVLFRLMFQSGLVKLTSGDEAWRNLTAMTYHYMTQPIPNPLSWYFHQFPLWFHKVSAIGMHVTELLVPFLIFFGRWPRLIAAGLLASLQLFIFTTGNYCFFNILAILLCLPLIDDQFFNQIFYPQFIKKVLRLQPNPQEQKSYIFITKSILIYFLAALIVIITFGHFIGVNRMPKTVQYIARTVRPFFSINRYGLFAVMTTERPEIIIEGSSDGISWKAYEFKWKPGDLARQPSQVAPHQPRLDWQMWFGALGGSCRTNRWFLPLASRLLQNSEPVIRLFDYNPFPDRPPQYIRAKLYQYVFTDWKSHKASGDWWQREYISLYCPKVSLQ